MKFTKRLCAPVSDHEFVRFKKRAGEKFKYKKGFTEKAMRESIYIWEVYQDIPKKLRLEILEHAKNKYPEKHELVALQDLIIELMYDYIKK